MSRRPRIPGTSSTVWCREVVCGVDPTAALIRAVTQFSTIRRGQVWSVAVHHDDGCPSLERGGYAGVYVRDRRVASEAGGVNVELHGLEETIRTIVREEVDAALALERTDGWLSSVEAADYLGISVGHLHNLKGTVPSRKVGGRRRYRRSELDAYQGERR